MLRDEIGKKNIQLRKSIQNKIKRYQKNEDEVWYKN